jgi:PKD repeat protein
LPGTYTVTLTVRDEGGNVDTATITVFVEPAGIFTPEMTLIIAGISAAVLTVGVVYLFMRRRERRE